MSEAEIDLFHCERARLFGVALSSTLIADITRQVTPLEFKRAMQALAVYRTKTPYRGFFIAQFNEIYNRERVAAPAYAEATAAPLSNDAAADKRRERADFERVPLASRIAIDARYPDIAALPRRSYEMCVVLAHAGCSIEQYRTNDPYRWPVEESISALVVTDQLRRERIHTGLIAQYRAHHRHTGEKVGFDVAL
jgi:hypothetical protein